MDSLSAVLQASVGPSVLISAAGLILLSLAQRIARPIDRIRVLCATVRQASAEEKESIKQQIQILYHRARLLRLAITLLILGITFVASTILLIFIDLSSGLDLKGIIQFNFVASLSLIVASVSLYIVDITTTLQSLKIEIRSALKDIKL